MYKYFSMFNVVGEVADTKLFQEPEFKLLVDISQDPPGHESTSLRKYPNRTSFTIFDRSLAKRFMAEVKVGTIIEVSGTFSQSNYIPHHTTYIDTVFAIEDFSTPKFSPRKLAKSSQAESRKSGRQVH